MRLLSSAILSMFLVLTVVLAVAVENAKAEDSAAVKASFANPPREYATAPLWVWNDLLSEEQIRGTLQDLAGQKVMQAFVHPRPGLMTPYMSKDWFRLWRIALDEAEKLDMNIWIYDENSYPSGFAGGLVPEAMPESRGKDLRVSEVEELGELGDDLFAVYSLSDDGFKDVTKDAKAAKKLPKGKYLVLNWVLARSSGWFGGKFYVDLLKPGVTEKFIEVTYEKYKKELGEHFGKRIPGIFTDEPHLRPAYGIHWNDHLSEEFKKRWGYALEDHLPSLIKPVGDWKKIRHNYQNVLLEQFIEHWSIPCHKFCEDNGVEFTGHYWEHGWPGASHGPDNMAMYAWHQRPAIDQLMNRYAEGPNSQFGNFRAVKELSSVANQFGRKRTLCEAYGAAGWELRFEDMKRIGDWLYVLGVNTLDEHISYITIRGARKRDHPQAFSYHTPWWESYHMMAEYFTRLSLALSSGYEKNGVLVIEPTTTAWMYQGDPKLQQIGNDFQKLVTDLCKAQAEFDLGSEDIIARHGSFRDLTQLDGSPGPTDFIVGGCEYHTVVLPPHTENLNAATMKLLRDFANRGGRVLCGGPPPSLIDGKPSPLGKDVAENPRWKQVAPEELTAAIVKIATPKWVSFDCEDNGGMLLHQRRHLEDGQLLFMVNTSIEKPVIGELTCAFAGIERWDLNTGKIVAHPFEKTDDGLKVDLDIAPCGSLLLFLSDKPIEPGKPEPKKFTAIASDGPTNVRRVGPNVLTIDYVDVTAGGETKKKEYIYTANQFVFQKHGFERNPWDCAVQLRDNLIKKTFPAGSGFEATYRFNIAESVPNSLEIVIERPDLYKIACNGKPVTATEGKWWLDKAFGRIDIAAVAKVGPNEVTIKASPMTMFHELEPAYVIGDFGLESADSGFTIVPDKPLKLGPWNKQAHQMLAGNVAYSETFDVKNPKGRYYVSMPKWYGSVAKVSVNGKPVGHISYQPWRCEVTESIKPGVNTVVVEIIGTLKNTLGPHHNNPRLGSVWPSAFRKGPASGPPAGESYHTVEYGLFEPFTLQQVE